MAQHKDAIYPHVIRLINSGMPRRDVARTLGLPQQSVYNAVARARRAGFVVNPTPNGSGNYYARQQQAMGSLRIGSLADLLDRLGAAQVAHWTTQMPPGSTLVEYLAAILTDAYNDE